MTVTANITNTGTRAGDDVGQLYLHETGTSILQPVRRLAGFQRLTLSVGQTRQVTFTLKPAQLGFYNNPSSQAPSTYGLATAQWAACTASSPCADDTGHSGAGGRA